MGLKGPKDALAGWELTRVGRDARQLGAWVTVDTACEELDVTDWVWEVTAMVDGGATVCERTLDGA